MCWGCEFLLVLIPLVFLHRLPEQEEPSVLPLLCAGFSRVRPTLPALLLQPQTHVLFEAAIFSFVPKRSLSFPLCGSSRSSRGTSEVRGEQQRGGVLQRAPADRTRRGALPVQTQVLLEKLWMEKRLKSCVFIVVLFWHMNMRRSNVEMFDQSKVITVKTKLDSHPSEFGDKYPSLKNEKI